MVSSAPEVTEGKETAVRVFVVAEVRLFREGLARELEREPGVTVLGAASASEAAAHIVSLPPCIVLTDPTTIRGTDLARLAAECGSRVVVFAVADDNDEEVLACVEAGVAGLTTRNASLKDLISALQTAARGDVYCSPRIAALVMRRVACLASLRSPDTKRTNLTRRERQVAALLDRGSSNKEIAAALGIETATVKNHVHSLLEKLQVRRRSEVPSVLRVYAEPAVRPTTPRRSDLVPQGKVI